MLGFQHRVRHWVEKCFGLEIANDKQERTHRFLEEAIELSQAAGCSAEEAHQLVDYVFGRPVGELRQEVGGVAVTLAAFCSAFEIYLEGAQEDELNRCYEKIDKVREKQKSKPQFGPLPGTYKEREPFSS